MWHLLGTEEHCVAVAELDALLFPDNCFNETTIRNELRAGARGCIIPESFEHPLGPDNRVKGYLLSKEKDGITDILRVGVHPEHRRQGLGRQMLGNELLNETEFMLCVDRENKAALMLYLWHGFKIDAVIGIGDKPDSHWVLVKKP